MAKEQEKLCFKVPGSYMEAEFIKYKNLKWKFCAINTRDGSRKLLKRSIDNDIVVKIIEDMVTKPEELTNKNFNKSYQTLKTKVETMEENKINNDYERRLLERTRAKTR